MANVSDFVVEPCLLHPRLSLSLLPSFSLEIAAVKYRSFFAECVRGEFHMPYRIQCNRQQKAAVKSAIRWTSRWPFTYIRDFTLEYSSRFDIERSCTVKYRNYYTNTIRKFICFLRKVMNFLLPYLLRTKIPSVITGQNGWKIGKGKKIEK